MNKLIHALSFSLCLLFTLTACDTSSSGGSSSDSVTVTIKATENSASGLSRSLAAGDYTVTTLAGGFEVAAFTIFSDGIERTELLRSLTLAGATRPNGMYQEIVVLDPDTPLSSESTELRSDTDVIVFTPSSFSFELAELPGEYVGFIGDREYTIYNGDTDSPIESSYLNQASTDFEPLTYLVFSVAHTEQEYLTIDDIKAKNYGNANFEYERFLNDILPGNTSFDVNQPPDVLFLPMSIEEVLADGNITIGIDLSTLLDRIEFVDNPEPDVDVYNIFLTPDSNGMPIDYFVE